MLLTMHANIVIIGLDTVKLSHTSYTNVKVNKLIRFIKMTR